MPYEMIEVTQKGEWSLITINRPKALNALNRKVLEELGEEQVTSPVC